MNEEPDIPFPVRFNVFKHHRNYIMERLDSASSDLIIALVDPICNNYVDIYMGALSPEVICSKVIAQLKSRETYLKDDFFRWIQKNNGFQKIKLDDQSVWIVRKSNDTERYIHLHPARTGPLTIRFKGSTLKTVYQLKINSECFGTAISVDNVNLIRIQVGLSPIKKLEKNKGILNCYERFFDPDC